MIWLWLLLAPYLLALLICWRMIAGHLAWQMHAAYQREYPRLGEDRIAPTGDQWFGAICGGLLAAILWPLALLFAMWPIAIGAERRARHAQKIRERDDIIARLERELDMR